MNTKNSLSGVTQLKGRSLINGAGAAAGSAENWMGAVGFGSFAYLGQSVSHQTPVSDAKLYLALEIGEKCQLRCRHCIYHRSEPASRQPSALVEQRLVDAFSRGLDPLWVSFAGKEPTLYPEHLLRQAASVRKPGRTNILMTNGLKLSGGLLDRLAEVIDYFDISVDGDEAAHDWMRGEGMFLRTWKNIRAVLDRTVTNVAVIATLVHAQLPSGRPQREDIAALARRLRDDFGGYPQITLSISLYYGLPGDPMLLDAGDIAALITELMEIDFPSRILFTANYAHLWPDVCDAMGWNESSIVYDVPTGFAILQQANVTSVLFNLGACPQFGLRVSNEGRVFLSCNHLTLGEHGSDFHVADLSLDELDSVIARTMSGQTRYSNELDSIPHDCSMCQDWSRCLGGDRLSGIYFDSISADPYCERIERSYS